MCNCKCKKQCVCHMENYADDMFETKCSNVSNDACGCNKDKCACGFDEEEDTLFPQNPMFGQSYVPWQTMDKTFRPEVGLCKGTIFPELVQPYEPCQSIAENDFIRATNSIGEGCNR